MAAVNEAPVNGIPCEGPQSDPVNFRLSEKPIDQVTGLKVRSRLIYMYAIMNLATCCTNTDI